MSENFVLIDTPSPFASLEEWVAYRRTLDSDDFNRSEFDQLKSDADAMIEKLKS